jgi:hypothetical protein
MAPRTTTSMFLLLLAFSSLTAGKEPGHRPKRHCKAVPGTPSWPSTESWARLNESVDGRLLRPSPPGCVQSGRPQNNSTLTQSRAVCHSGQPTFNTTQCATVKAAVCSLDCFGHSLLLISPSGQLTSSTQTTPCLSTGTSGATIPVFLSQVITAAVQDILKSS